MSGPIGTLIRIVQGERLRKCTPRESQCYSACFALIAVYFSTILFLLKFDGQFFEFMDSDGPMALIVIWTIVISILCFVGWFWGRHVPAKVSYLVAAILWPTLFVLALTGHIGPPANAPSAHPKNQVHTTTPIRNPAGVKVVSPGQSGLGMAPGAGRSPLL
jgi:fatty acid desaturase